MKPEPTLCAALATMAIALGLGACNKNPVAPVDSAASPAAATSPPSAQEPTLPDNSFFALSATNIDGQNTPLSTYKGKVLLVVNTASECGKTPQYAGLEALWKEYKDKGLVVLGFPSNDFGGQEPGTAQEIKTFCTTRYAVTFPLFDKVVTKGEGQSDIYAFLTKDHDAPKWNFHKYVVGKDGQVAAAFASGVEPGADELRAAIDTELAK